MRVGNTQISTPVDNGSNIEQNRTTAPQTVVRPEESSSRNTTAQTGMNLSAAMRRAETGIDAGLRENQIRANATPSLDSILQNMPAAVHNSPPASLGQDSLTATGTATPNAAIRDNQTTTSTININDDLSITGVKVNLDIAHTYRGDLVVKLRSPEGKEVTLHNRAGGSADNLVLEANPADFNGLNSKGAWSLVVQDAAAQDVGTLKSWGLAVSGNPKTQDKNVINKTATPNAPIKDLQTTTSTIAITDEGQVQNLKVNVDIGHTYRGDLVVKLKSPSGKEVTLANKEGGSADNLTFELDKSTDFANEPVKGNWTLTVQDTARADEGTLKSWGLSITKKGGGNPQPQPTTTSLQVAGDATFRQQVATHLDKFAPGTTVDSQGFVHAATTQATGHTQGYQLINNLLNNPNKVTIQFTANNAFTQSGAGATVDPTTGQRGAGSFATVSYDPNLAIELPTQQVDGTISDEVIAGEVILAHELVHAVHAQRGEIDRKLLDHTFTDGGQKFKENWRYEEFRTTGFTGFRVGNETTENSVRAELGFRPRATYLDRGSWTAVNGINGITAQQPNANGPVANLISDPWSVNGKGMVICNCFGCMLQSAQI
jgi:subtilisin-like proprotein convertase family protein